MQLLKSLIILIVGFVLLIKGADFFVEGSSAVAKRLRIPSMIIGMTIVAMGTSLPECAVSVTASLTGNNSLAISNAVGSNIFNLLVVCGVCTLFVPLAVQKSTLQKEFPLSIFCAGLLLLLGYLGMTLGRIDGILFLIIFTGYLLWMIRSVKRARRTTTPDAISSIQEESILLVLGVAAAISPVAFAWDNMIDIAVLIVISVITLIFAWTSKELNRKEGIIMLILYAAYMVYICIR